MSTHEPEPTEEELRAAYEQEIKRIRVEQVVLEHVVTIVNLGMRRTGLAPGTEDERDPDQVHVAIEAVRGVLPLLEQIAPRQVPSIRDALSQLQLAYVRIGGKPPAEAQPGGGPPDRGGAADVPQPEPEPEPVKPGEPGPAQRSGRLWVPGQ